jgi:ribosomal protein L11 methyltransferase
MLHAESWKRPLTRKHLRKPTAVRIDNRQSEIDNPHVSLWFEITARVPPDQVDAVAAVMRDVSPGGVAVEEAIDILGPEMGYTVRADEPVLVRAYLPSSELGAVLTEDLRQAMEAYPAVELTAKPLYEEDWSVSWREFFGVVDTGKVVIVPSWIEHEVRPGQLAILLDPGRAFGTGHHETTRLCLQALADLVAPGMRVLDVGTGSGVLAIAAVKLGASHVDAIDIDPIAAEVAAENCAINGVTDQVSISAGKLETREPAYDLVVANISTEANIGMAEAFAATTMAGGHLVLSGILTQDWDRVIGAMEAAGFAHQVTREEQDWALFHFTR